MTDNQWPPIVHNFGARERSMADAITAYWANMALAQNPNGDGASASGAFPVPLRWPAFDSTQQYIVLDLPFSVERNLKQTVCDWCGSAVRC